MVRLSKVFRVAFIGMMVAAMALAAGCGASKSASQSGGAGGKVELKLAYHLPVDHHLSKSIERFAKRVNEKSNGRITVTTYPAGQLYTDKSMNDAIMSGGLDMGLNSTAMWTTVVPVLNVLDVPFLLPNYDSVAKAIDGGLGKTLGEALIEPTKIYVKAMRSVKESGVVIKGASHITGGGFYENIPRMLPDGIAAKINKNSYDVPPIFRLMASEGKVEEHVMYNTYNMGIGMVLAVDSADADKTVAALKAANENAYILGEAVTGEKGVILC